MRRVLIGTVVLQALATSAFAQPLRSDELQAPREEEPQAPRTDEIQAPLG